MWLTEHGVYSPDERREVIWLVRRLEEHGLKFLTKIDLDEAERLVEESRRSSRAKAR